MAPQAPSLKVGRPVIASALALAVTSAAYTVTTARSPSGTETLRHPCQKTTGARPIANSLSETRDKTLDRLIAVPSTYDPITLHIRPCRLH